MMLKASRFIIFLLFTICCLFHQSNFFFLSAFFFRFCFVDFFNGRNGAQSLMISCLCVFVSELWISRLWLDFCWWTFKVNLLWKFRGENKVITLLVSPLVSIHYIDRRLLKFYRSNKPEGRQRYKYRKLLVCCIIKDIHLKWVHG